MQLPRGTLHSIKKDILPSNLFKEISEEKFTGHCNIYFNSDTASTVFRDGRCILAKTGQFCGFDAFKRIEMDPSPVSAELYAFTETQIGLSNEFNAECTVVFPKKEPIVKSRDEKKPLNDSKVMAEVKRQKLSEESIRKDSPDDVNTIFEFRPAVNPKIKKPKSDFQLPRGKFVATQNSVQLIDVFRSVEENNFSGYMVIDIGIRKASLIYRTGMCVMIDYPPKYGEEAIHNLQKDFEKKVKAELYDLSHQQMDLALEFNDGYWANTWTKGTGVSITSLSKEIIEDNRKIIEEKITEEIFAPESKKTPFEIEKSKWKKIHTESSEETEYSEISESKDQDTEEHDTEEQDNEELDEFAQEVNTLENMDMELMESRVRENFRDVIKELDLDYLIIDATNEKRKGNIND